MIKSFYNLKLIFSYIDEEHKLILIKENKYLQTKININIINYKLFKGIYIIFESNIKGKEYNGYKEQLVFEGEYLNRKRSGKGKEYYLSGKLKFEGEYLNGKRNGKGKEYWPDGKLMNIMN